MDQQEKNVVTKIREEYIQKENNTVEHLKRLDQKVKRPVYIFAYTFGIIGTLVLGTGMCLAMKVIGNWMALGICIGILGIIMVSINYPIYQKWLAKRKQKYQKEILALSEQALNA
ncbi:MAG: hypothetical protein NC182_07630 [Prevotella sp.]|nr:hypothetical protein [Staphylococcus sp.]MCM1351054.1 hypothetical protein [Prevotella sp.]